MTGNCPAGACALLRVCVLVGLLLPAHQYLHCKQEPCQDGSSRTIFPLLKAAWMGSPAVLAVSARAGRVRSLGAKTAALYTADATGSSVRVGVALLAHTCCCASCVLAGLSRQCLHCKTESLLAMKEMCVVACTAHTGLRGQPDCARRSRARAHPWRQDWANNHPRRPALMESCPAGPCVQLQMASWQSYHCRHINACIARQRYQQRNHDKASGRVCSHDNTYAPRVSHHLMK